MISTVTESSPLKQAPEPGSKTKNNKKAKKARVSQSKETWELVELGKRTGALEFFVNSFDNQVYATIKVKDGQSETDLVDSPAFDHWIRNYYLKKTGTPISNGLVSDLVATVKAVTYADGKRIPVYKRIGYTEIEGRIVTLYYDLGNGKVVEIASRGWRVISASEAPVKFRFTSEMAAQIEPVKGGSIEELWKFIPITNPIDRILLTGWHLGAYRPKPAWWILEMTGPQGAGKTTVMRVEGKLIDPSRSESPRKPKDVRDAGVACNSNYLARFSNLSYINPEMADLFCGQSTATSVTERQLRTNSGVHSYQLGGPLMVEGIPDLTTRPDMVNRRIKVPLSRFTGKRKAEEDFWREFELARPRLLGAIFSVLSGILKNLPTTKLENLPRMADATVWVSAGEEALGWESGTFARVYNQSCEESSMNILEGNPLADALVELMDGEAEWIGTATELLKKLTDSPFASLKLPDSSQKLRNALRRLEVDLPAIGLNIECASTTSRKLPNGEDSPDGRSERWIVITKKEKE